MNTPNFSSIFDFLEKWGTSHKFVLVLIASLGGSVFTYMSTQLVHAQDFTAFKKETQAFQASQTFALDILDKKLRLQDTRKNIEILEDIPATQRPDSINRTLERLKREEALLESKINS